MILQQKYIKREISIIRMGIVTTICNNISIMRVLIQQFGISYLPNSRNY